jgi:hypothetical protein
VGIIEVKMKVVHTDTHRVSKNSFGSTLGRFPANVIHDGSDEVFEGVPRQQRCICARKKWAKRIWG